MSKQLKNLVTKFDHIMGSERTPLQLLEYGDYQCPSCSESYLVIVIREILKSSVAYAGEKGTISYIDHTGDGQVICAG